jgi:hypothetical protein
MSRQRMIRPEFFVDAELADLPPITRLLFIGLWTLADREGRLKDRPRMIKLAILPADEGNVDEMLEQLSAIGSIRRYEVDGVRYIDIPGFITYQRIHPREAQSEIPPFKTRKVTVLQESRVKDEHSRVKVSSLDVDVSLEKVVKDKCSSSTYTSDFENFWTAFPPKPHNNKKGAWRCWQTRLRAGEDKDRMIAASRHYALTRAALDPTFTMLAQTFLGPDLRYEAFVDPPNGNGGNGHKEAPEGMRWATFVDYDERGHESVVERLVSK